MARVAVANWTFTIPGADLNVDRKITKEVRQNTKLRGMAKRRARYAFQSKGTCSLCLLALCFNVEEGDPARGEYGHTVALKRWGTSQPINYSGQHAECNAAAQRAGAYDLREWIDAGAEWPDQAATLRWEKTPHARRVRSGLPTVEDMAAARAERGMPF